MSRKKQEELSVIEQIPFHKDVRFNKNLTFGERVFLSEIYARAKNGVCPFSLNGYKNLFQVTYPTLKNWIKKLVQLNLIEIGVDKDNPDCKHYFKFKSGK